MSYSPTKQRTKIVTAVRERVHTLFNTATGTEQSWLRQVRRGPVQPVEMFPACTVRDAGQRRVGGRSAEQTQDRALAIDVILHLAEAWERVDVDEELTDQVETLIYALHGYCPPHGVRRMDYEDDEKPDVVFFSGATNALWILTFRCEYFTAVGPRANR